MNLQIVVENLRNTIKGKERYLSLLGNTRDMDIGAAMASEATRAMLEINIDELHRILKDVEQCIEKKTV